MKQIDLGYEAISIDKEIKNNYKIYLIAEDEALADVMRKELFGNIKLLYKEENNFLYITILLIDRGIKTAPFAIPKSEKSNLYKEWMDDDKIKYLGVVFYKNSVPHLHGSIIQLSF